MLDQDDLKWIAGQLTDLNRRLQQVSRSSAQGEEEDAGSECLRSFHEEVAQASKTSQALLDRITSRLLAAANRAVSQANGSPAFRVIPPVSLGAHSPVSSTQKLPVGELTIPSGRSNGVAIRNPRGHRELILVVDDEPEILERAGAILEEEDYRIILAKDGFEALQVYGQLAQKISLIILDFFLPVMDGDAVFDELKAINPKVQVVLSSGFAEQTKLGSMLARGLCGFIPKPYTGEKLIEQVRSVIAA